MAISLAVSRVVLSALCLVSLTTGVSEALEYTYDSTDVPKALNGAGVNGLSGAAVVTSTITVPSQRTEAVGRIAVSLYLPSTATSGLQISLTAPDGKKIILVEWVELDALKNLISKTTEEAINSDKTKGYGIGPELEKRVYFVDGALNSAGDAPQYAYNNQSFPYLPPGQYVPYGGRLATFAGGLMAGTWTLKVQNSFSARFWTALGPGSIVGSLQAWSLHLIPQSAYTWNGAAGDHKWSNPRNWRGSAAPSSGEQLASLVFPAGLETNLLNDLYNFKASSVVIAGDGYSISPSGPNRGATLTLSDGATLTTSGTTVINSASTFFDDTSLSLAGQATISTDGNLRLAGRVVDYNDVHGDDKNSNAVYFSEGAVFTGSIRKTGSGVLNMTGIATHSGLNDIRNGVVRINGVSALGQNTAVDVNGGTLELAFSNVFDLGGGLAPKYLLLRGQGYDGNGALVVANTSNTGVATTYTASVSGNVTFGLVTNREADDLDVRSSSAVAIGARPGSTLLFSPTEYASPTNVTLSSGTAINWEHQALPVRIVGGVGSSVSCTKVDADHPTLPSHVLAVGSGLNCTLASGVVADSATVGALDQATVTFGGDETVADVLIGSGAMIRSPSGTLTVASRSLTCSSDAGTKASVITGTWDMGSAPTLHVSLGSNPSPCLENLRLGVNGGAACALMGATSLVKDGGGNLALTNCTFSGTPSATINGGGLVALSSNLGAVTVNGGFLGGTATITGAVVVKASAGIDPGRPMIDSAQDDGAVRSSTEGNFLGTLTCASTVTFEDKSYFTVDMIPGDIPANNDADGFRDQLKVTGTISLGQGCRLRPIWRSTANPPLMVTLIDTMNGFGADHFFALPEGAGITYAGGADHSDAELTVSGLVNFATTAAGANLGSGHFTFPEVILPSGATSIAALPLVSTGNGAVHAATIDGSALKAVDYDALVDGYRLSFSVGGPVSEVKIPLIYNMTIRSDREFTVPLYSPTDGAALRYPFTATVTVTDVNFDQDEKTSKCGMASGFAALFLALCAMARVLALRRRAA